MRLTVKLLLVGLLGYALATGGESASAFHPFAGSGQLNINYLHSDFEPGGDGRINYRLCDDQGYGIPAQWQEGVEKWDLALGPTMDFDPVSGSCNTTTDGSGLLRWENGTECNSGSWACWRTWTNSLYYTQHGSHDDIKLGLVVFDRAAWVARPTDQWRRYISAHEWGHDLSLADHVSHNCGENTLMLNYLNGYVPPNPCGEDPTAADRDGVRCIVYQRCSETKQMLSHASFEHGMSLPDYPGGPWKTIQPSGGTLTPTLTQSPSFAECPTLTFRLYAMGPNEYQENQFTTPCGAPTPGPWYPVTISLDVSQSGATGLRAQVFISTVNMEVNMDATGSSVSR